MKLSDQQLDELANVWFTSDNEYWRTQPAHTVDRWRYRMTKVVEALEKMTNEAKPPTKKKP